MSAPAGSAAAAEASPAELAHFGQLAHSFWDPEGPLRTLHDINPVRVDYLRAHLLADGLRSADLEVADVGCGGGLLAESLAGLGARVTAIDLAPEMIEVARLHAMAAGLTIDYRQLSAEALAHERPGSFALVTCMELIEHVPEPATLLGALATLLAPGGLLLLSTLNRTPQSFLGAIVGAEYLLGLVPRGTHRYAQLRRPSEVAAWARAAGLRLTDVTGLRYNPFTRRAQLGGAPDINYLASFTRDH